MTRAAPYQAGDACFAEYPTQWGALSGKGVVLACEPCASCRWTVTVRIGDEERAEAVTMTYTVNSRGNATTGRYIRKGQ